jgi:hypothetical protein
VLLMLRWPRYACSVRVSVPWFASAYPQACLSMCGCALISSLAVSVARSTMRRNPDIENGAPRSETNTNGDVEPSRCSRSIFSRAPRKKQQRPGPPSPDRVQAQLDQTMRDAADKKLIAMDRKAWLRKHGVLKKEEP